jgi:glyoxylate carboligase
MRSSPFKVPATRRRPSLWNSRRSLRLDAGELHHLGPFLGVVGNPGTTELPLIDALVDAPDISYVLALQEASAVAMADGYAQAAGRPGVLSLHTAGGLGHGLGNLLNASVSGTPLVVTADRTPATL